MLFEQGELVYKGLFLDNKLLEGTIYNKEKKIYEGEFSDNIPDGSGKIFNNKDVILIEGKFFEGKLLKGKWYQNHKVVYDGEFRNWFFNGEGIFYNYPNNTILYKGKFIDGKISY